MFWRNVPASLYDGVIYCEIIWFKLILPANVLACEVSFTFKLLLAISLDFFIWPALDGFFILLGCNVVFLTCFYYACIEWNWCSYILVPQKYGSFWYLMLMTLNGIIALFFGTFRSTLKAVVHFDATWWHVSVIVFCWTLLLYRWAIE